MCLVLCCMRRFESVLTDYDVCSNWGNWVAAAGLTGGRVNKFNISKQSKVRHSSWLCLHCPHMCSPSAWARLCVQGFLERCKLLIHCLVAAKQHRPRQAVEPLMPGPGLQDYDADGAYVKHWCPELAKVPASHVHEPWKLSPQEQEHYGVQIGRDYPEPLTQPKPGAR